jgi:hypothetical protein
MLAGRTRNSCCLVSRNANCFGLHAYSLGRAMDEPRPPLAPASLSSRS